MPSESQIELVRARFATRARAVRVGGGVENPRAEIETDYMTWLSAISPEQMGGYRELASFHHELLTHAWAIRRGVRPKPFFAFWFMGAGKNIDPLQDLIRALGLSRLLDADPYLIISI